MPPKFSLQPVLDYRQTRVEILEIEYGKVLQAQQHARTFMEALQSSRSRILEQLSECQRGEIDIFLISHLHSNLDAVNDHIRKQEVRLEELAKEVKLKQQEVVLAKQDSEALVKLKNKEIETYLQEQVQIENRLQDDIYIARAFRRSNSVA